MSQTLDKPQTKVRVGPGRLAFPYIFEPQKNDAGDDRYNTVLLLPPDYDTRPIVAALTAAAVDKWGKDKAKWPKGMRRPEDCIRDAEEKSQWDGFLPGWKYITCSAQQTPAVVDAMREDVTDPREVYGGRWAKLSLNAFAFKNKTTGVSLGLNGVQLLKKDTAFGKGGFSKDDFDDEVQDMEEEGGFE